MARTLIALAACALLLGISGATELELLGSNGRQLTAYEGCTNSNGVQVCTTDNGDGTSTTCTTSEYYTGCSTYDNGDGAGRKLLASPSTSCRTSPGSKVCTTDNGNGTSTICVTTPYYSGCNTYINGEGRRLLSVDDNEGTLIAMGHARKLTQHVGCVGGPQQNIVCTTYLGNGIYQTCTNTANYQGCHKYQGAVPTDTSSSGSSGSGKKLLAITDKLFNLGRSLTAYSGCSNWTNGGYTCITDNKNGTSTTCTNSVGYYGCTTYPNGERGRKLLSFGLSQEDLFKNGRRLTAYSGCSSGDWGSVCTTDNQNGTSSTCTNTDYYSGCSTYPNGE